MIRTKATADNSGYLASALRASAQILYMLGLQISANLILTSKRVPSYM
jgi:hypothetical protein